MQVIVFFFFDTGRKAKAVRVRAMDQKPLQQFPALKILLHTFKSNFRRHGQVFDVSRS